MGKVFHNKGNIMLDNYKQLDNGVIKQVNITSKVDYNEAYIENSYNTYGTNGTKLAHLRLGFLLGLIHNHDSIIDVGYGNGDFLDACTNTFSQCYGNDISEYKLPDTCDYISYDDMLKKEVDVITFFDSLEHFEDISFVKDLKAKYILISVPWCHYKSDKWFDDWKHRRPDEHLWHFNEKSLCEFMKENGYINKKTSNIEDIIRKTEKNEYNILTVLFERVK
jgi:hypothetical protein